MTGCVALRKDVYYVRLTYYDRHHARKDKKEVKKIII